VLGENEDDKLEDLAGYTGDIHKNKMERGIKRLSMAVEDFLELVCRKNKLKEVGLAFKEIDPDRTGCVTAPEIDDLFRCLYPDEFRTMNMFEVIKPFEIPSNRILIEYGKFRQWLIFELSRRKLNIPHKQMSMTAKSSTPFGKSAYEKLTNARSRSNVQGIAPQ
jgi:hypothetical protein